MLQIFHIESAAMKTKTYAFDKARGQRIEQARNECGLTQGELAKRMGKKHHVVISRWERGDPISDKSLQDLAKALGMESRKDWLVYGDKGPSLPSGTIESISASIRTAKRILEVYGIDIDSDIGQRFMNAVIRMASESGPVSEAVIREWLEASKGEDQGDQ